MTSERRGSCPAREIQEIHEIRAGLCEEGLR